MAMKIAQSGAHPQELIRAINNLIVHQALGGGNFPINFPNNFFILIRLPHHLGWKLFADGNFSIKPNCQLSENFLTRSGILHCYWNGCRIFFFPAHVKLRDKFDGN